MEKAKMARIRRDGFSDFEKTEIWRGWKNGKTLRGIGRALGPITRRVPYIAPSLPQLLRYVGGAGLRVLTWRDTTAHVLEYFDPIKTAMSKALPQASGDGQANWWKAAVDGYIETLANLGGQTGILCARRVGD
jgi:hypothetical protein